MVIVKNEMAHIVLNRYNYYPTLFMHVFQLIEQSARQYLVELFLNYESQPPAIFHSPFLAANFILQGQDVQVQDI